MGNMHGVDFPVQADRFDDYLAAFKTRVVPVAAGSGLRTHAKNFMWLREGKMKAFYIDAMVDVDVLSDVETALAYRSRWDAYMKVLNGTITGGDAPFHTSEMYVRADVQDELVQSIVTTIAIIIILAFLGMLAFTQSLSLSAITVTTTFTVICGLFFVIVVVMGNDIGPLETVSLIFFIGYSLTYTLHIAHQYGHKDQEVADEALPEGLQEGGAIRMQRASFALRSIGGAAAGSAFTTIGCAFFLLFCTLTVFRVLGGICVAVTILSIFMALVGLPAALMVVGPRNPGDLHPRFAKLLARVPWLASLVGVEPLCKDVKGSQVFVSD